MAPPKTDRPTKAELAIMQILWDQGPSTVRDVREKLDHGHRIGYTTVLKQLQVMQGKGFVSADDKSRSNIYTPIITEDEAQRRGRKALVKELYRGCARKLMLEAVAEERLSREDLLEIRRLINEMVRKK